MRSRILNCIIAAAFYASTLLLPLVQISPALGYSSVNPTRGWLSARRLSQRDLNHSGNGTWSVAYTATLSSNGGGETGAYRAVVSSIPKNISKIRISVQSPTSATTTTVGHFAACIRTTNDTCTTTPVEIKFAGASGWTGTGSGSVAVTATSDDTVFAASSGNDLLITSDLSGSIAPAYTTGGATNMYRITSGAYYNQTSMGGTLNGSGIRAAIVYQVEIFG